MEASKKNPIYTVYLISGNTKYNLTPATENIDFSDKEKQMAQMATIKVVNVRVNGKLLTDFVRVRDRVFIYADDGEKSDEVFRGFVWTRTYKSSLDGYNLTLKCYDHLIYYQESEESIFFPSGKSTKDVMSSICSNWGINLSYTYESITHAKLALRGTLSDIFTDDILDLVKDRTGKKYVILSEKDTMIVRGLGANKTVYTLKQGEGGNAIQTGSESTMDGMVTNVKILGKADGDDREPVEGTVSGSTAAYGTLQKLISRKENTSLADAKKEAQSIIDENGTPKWEYQVTAVDIPWIRKGDKVKLWAGDLVRSYIVTGIDRDISLKKKTMTLTMEDV